MTSNVDTTEVYSRQRMCVIHLPPKTFFISIQTKQNIFGFTGNLRNFQKGWVVMTTSLHQACSIDRNLRSFRNKRNSGDDVSNPACSTFVLHIYYRMNCGDDVSEPGMLNFRSPYIPSDEWWWQHVWTQHVDLPWPLFTTGWIMVTTCLNPVYSTYVLLMYLPKVVKTFLGSHGRWRSKTENKS